MHFRHAENIVCIATDVEGPIADSEARYMTEYLIEDEGKITSKKMWEIKLKKYIYREEIMQENRNKIYAIVIGKCIPSLQSTSKLVFECIYKYKVSM